MRTDIKLLYYFHQNNDDSKCEVAHTFPGRLVLGWVLVPGARMGTGTRSQEGHMAPKPKSKPARFVFTVGSVLWKEQSLRHGRYFSSYA
jgi:hypothetical protein